MDARRAQTIAARLHRADRDDDGTAFMQHLRRVALRVPAGGRAVAWLHEALERTPVSEQELLMHGLDGEQLRALRLLRRTAGAHSDAVYIAHIRLIACAAGPAGDLSRMVKVADLADRRRHPRRRANGWIPPYDRALRLLEAAGDAHGVAEAP